MPEPTAFEKRVMEERRQGKNVEAVQVQTPGGVPVVSLREFANRETAVIQPPPEVSEPPSPKLEVLAQTAPAASKVTNEDLDRMKDMAFGKKPDETKQEPEDPPTTEGIKRCARCGWERDKVLDYEVTKDDKIEFVESVLGGRRFVKPVSLLGGRMTATFRSCLLAEEDMIAKFLQAEVAAKRITSPEEWMIWYGRCRLVVMLQVLELGGKTKEFPEVNDKTYKPNPDVKDDSVLQKALREVPANWPMTVHALLIQTLAEFDSVYATLMSRAYDQDFWTGLTEK